ncbi:MAG: kynureninase [Acidimicrobiales bacterium]
MAPIVGASAAEVTTMNSLTTNLHLLMVSFYEPTPERHKILIDDHAFPSDHFAVESQIRQRGFDPSTSLVTVAPRPGAHLIEHDDILAAIEEHGDELALVMWPGVQYYTGQVFDLPAIAAAARHVGAQVGFDLAHAAGNIELALHDWDVDFAAWCTYQYINGGPGSIAGAFVHERHHGNPNLPRFLGWWGTKPETRFEMATTFESAAGASGWQVSCGSILSQATLIPQLQIVEEAGGMPALRAKAESLVAFLDRLLDDRFDGRIRQANPRGMAERGCQFALEVVAPGVDGRAVFEALEARGVACDWRYPNVIRVAPVPLYTRFVDLVDFVEILDELVTAAASG